MALSLALHATHTAEVHRGALRHVHLWAVAHVWTEPHGVKCVALACVQQVTLRVNLRLRLRNRVLLLQDLRLVVLHRVEVEEAATEAIAFLDPC